MNLTKVGAAAFTDLTDVPSAYAGKSGKVAVVNVGENGLELETLIAKAITLNFPASSVFFKTVGFPAEDETQVTSTFTAIIISNDLMIVLPTKVPVFASSITVETGPVVTDPIGFLKNVSLVDAGDYRGISYTKTNLGLTGDSALIEWTWNGHAFALTIVLN